MHFGRQKLRINLSIVTRSVEFEPLLGSRYARGNYAANYGTASWGIQFWKEARYRGVWAFHAPGASAIGLDCDVKCQGINGDLSREWIPYCAAVDTRFPCSPQNNAMSNAGPRSKHPTRANFVRCDGSTRFFGDNTDVQILVALFTSGASDVSSTEE